VFTLRELESISVLVWQKRQEVGKRRVRGELFRLVGELEELRTLEALGDKTSQLCTQLREEARKHLEESKPAEARRR